MGPAEVGRAEELAFFAECLRRGLEVYDAVSPASVADCMVGRKRVQIKKLRADGRLSCVRSGYKRQYSIFDCDVIVARDDGNRWVIYPTDQIVRDTATIEELGPFWDYWSVFDEAN